VDEVPFLFLPPSFPPFFFPRLSLVFFPPVLSDEISITVKAQEKASLNAGVFLPLLFSPFLSSWSGASGFWRPSEGMVCTRGHQLFREEGHPPFFPLFFSFFPPPLPFFSRRHFLIAGNEGPCSYEPPPLFFSFFFLLPLSLFPSPPQALALDGGLADDYALAGVRGPPFSPSLPPSPPLFSPPFPTQSMSSLRSYRHGAQSGTEIICPR